MFIAGFGRLEEYMWSNLRRSNESPQNCKNGCFRVEHYVPMLCKIEPLIDSFKICVQENKGKYPSFGGLSLLEISVCCISSHSQFLTLDECKLLTFQFHTLDECKFDFWETNIV